MLLFYNNLYPTIHGTIINIMNKEVRYKGDLNRMYELIMKAWPFEKELRNSLANIILEYVELKNRNLSILEIGSGSGESTICILNALKSKGVVHNVKYVSIDNDSSVIENQEKLLEDYGETLFLKNEDAFIYLGKVQDEEFDIVTSSWFLHNFRQEQRNELLNQIFRILKNGGIFVCMDKFVPDDASEADKLLIDQIRRFDIYENEGYSNLRDSMTIHELEDNSPEFIMKINDSIKVIEEIGFKNISESKRYLRDLILLAEK